MNLSKYLLILIISLLAAPIIIYFVLLNRGHFSNNPAFPQEVLVSNPLEGKSWQLVSYTLNERTILESTPTLTFSAEQITGNAGCNSFFADYTVDGALINIGDIGSTKMYCSNIEVEETFLQLLSQATHFDINNNLFLDSTGEAILEFSDITQ